MKKSKPMTHTVVRSRFRENGHRVRVRMTACYVFTEHGEKFRIDGSPVGTSASFIRPRLDMDTVEQIDDGAVLCSELVGGG